MSTKFANLAAIVCLTVCGPGLAQKSGTFAPTAGPQLATERGSLSFRGVRVALGNSSVAHDIVIRNRGDAPLTAMSAVTHGDFIIASNSCTQTLPPASSTGSRCVVSVAFRPTNSGLRTGDLTVRAAGAQPLIVPLVAGTPIDFGTVQQGETLLQWPSSPVSSAAVTGSVSGPFAMALQDIYTYGSINGVTFAETASSDAATGPVFLGVDFQATALGAQAGSIILSNDTTYDVTANVVSAQVATLAPTTASFDGFQLIEGDSSSNAVQSVSGPYPFVFTNDTGSALGITSIAADAPFHATNTCGASLASGSTCLIEVAFLPTATGLANGNLTVATTSGTYTAALSGTGAANPAQVSITPSANYFADLSAPGVVAPETVTIQNLSSEHSVAVALPGTCNSNDSASCYQITGNTCSTIPALGSCHFQLQYSSPISAFQFNGVNLTLTPSSGTTQHSYSINSLLLSSHSGEGIELLPQSLSFPATPVDGLSQEQLVTATNVTDQSLILTTEAYYEYSVEQSCGLLAPGQSCVLHVRYLPLGAGASNQSVTVVGNALSGAQIASGALAIQGYGIPTGAALATPGYPPFAGPISFGPVVDGTSVKMPLAVKNTGAAPLILNEVGMGTQNSGTFFAVDATQCTQPIAPGSQCTLTLNWLPTNCPQDPPSGDYCYDDAFLQLSGNAVSSTDQYLLEGLYTYASAAPTGVHQSSVPISTDFGFIPLGTSATSSTQFRYGLLSPDQQYQVTGAGFSVVNGCAGLTGLCTVSVIFSPTAPGFYHGTLRSYSSTNGLTTTNLSGSGVAMQLQASPQAVLFPNAIYSTPPETQQVVLTNVSGHSLALGQPYIQSGANSAFAISASTCSASLATAASCTLSITFNPGSAAGVPSAQDTLGINFGTGQLETLGLSASSALLTVSPTAVSFGSVTRGQTATQVFTIQEVSNPYFTSVTTRRVAITGTNATDFSVTANTCASFVLTAGVSCSVTVQFSPTAAGAESAALTVASDEGSATAPLSGTGVTAGPGATVHPERLDFGMLLVGSPGEPKKIVLHNPGSATLLLPSNPSIKGKDAHDFRLLGSCDSISPGSICELGVDFTPSGEGERSATLTVPTGGSEDSTASVSLNGVGCVSERRREAHDRYDIYCGKKEWQFEQGRPTHGER